MFVGRSLNGRVVSLLNDDPNAAAAQLGLSTTHPHPAAAPHHHHHQHHQATNPHLSHHQQPTQFNGSPLSAPNQVAGINQPPPPQQHQQAPPPNGAPQQQQRQPSTGAGAPLPPPPPQAQPNGGTGRMASSEKKRNHVCTTCSKAFTTSGHLARHIRVHTGERNHKCPFPGCETRCSRQDNLQQHFRIHLSPRSRRTSQAKRAQMAAANANAAAANANTAAVTAATGALTVSMGTDKAAAAGVGAVRRGRTTTKRDREIYTPTPPASPEASTAPQNGSYTSNGGAGGITLHPVPERSGNGATSVGDSYGNHAGSYGSVSLSYPGGPGVNGHHPGGHHTAGNGMVSPSSVAMAASTNYGTHMTVALNPYGVYAGQTEGPVMLFSPTDYPQPPHPNTHSHSTRDREGNGSNYPSPLSTTSSSHSSLNGNNGGGAGGHPGMHRSNSYASHHSSTHNSPYHSAVNIHSGSHSSSTYTSSTHSSPAASVNGHDDRHSQHQKYYVPPSSSYDDYSGMGVSMGSVPMGHATNMGSVNLSSVVPSPHDSSANGYSYNLPPLSTSISTASSGSSPTSSQSSSLSVSAGNNTRAAVTTASATSRAHLPPITTGTSASSVLSPLSSYDSPHLPHSAHPSSATTDYGASDVNVKVESPTSNANSPHLQHSHPGGGYGGHADMVGMGMMMSGIPTPVSWR